eukprot:CAMPEP_0170643190 /NCGR_PEP_ID=MMETSP0224-20130122/41746_1 /TAXON_ID=285029 /ORGANISM="Togula jolla, Strain CCCM 725" /LENGTH=412 /DNA_ID=CAMNT_0010973987 /DNA_START=27 /DNA_END=1266 /DNA_ORIENTATION=+
MCRPLVGDLTDGVSAWNRYAQPAVVDTLWYLSSSGARRPFRPDAASEPLFSVSGAAAAALAAPRSAGAGAFLARKGNAPRTDEVLPAGFQRARVGGQAAKVRLGARSASAGALRPARVVPRVAVARSASDGRAAFAALFAEPPRAVARSKPRSPSPRQSQEESTEEVHEAECTPLSEQSPSGLGASTLFEEVIRRDRIYGAVLREAKDAYDAFLRHHGTAVPSAPIASKALVSAAAAVSQGHQRATELPQQSPQRPRSAAQGGAAARLQPGRPERLSYVELAVDAARRPWTAGGEEVLRGDQVKVQELERENAALRLLVQRLRQELEEPLEPSGPLGAQGQEPGPLRPGLAASRRVLMPQVARLRREAQERLPGGEGRQRERRQGRPAEVPALDFSQLLELVSDCGYEAASW